MKSILKIQHTNGLWLKPLEWTAVLIITLAVVWLALPRWHERHLSIELPKDFRLSYKLRDDYLLYKSVAAKVVETHPALFIGDSVVWGMYVRNDHTLPAILNAKLGGEEIGNLAVDGLHPVVMETLMREYGKDVCDRVVYVYLNPLWMTSPLYDLSGDGELAINHPRLLPQFIDKPACYHASLEDRCKAVWERFIDFEALLHHVRVAFLDNQDVKTHLAKQPDKPLCKQLSLNIEPLEIGHAYDSKITWEDAGIAEQDWQWVPLDESRQWKSYLNTLELLKKRGNVVVAVVGTVNPFMQTAASLEKYRAWRADALKRLKEIGYKTVDLPELPSEEYGDASHPLAAGYERLAEFMMNNDSLKIQ